MTNTFEGRYLFSAQYLEHARQIWYDTFLAYATVEEDCWKGSDLALLRCGGSLISVRTRGWWYQAHYPDQITIRYPSEWRKLAQGCTQADVLMYGFADEVIPRRWDRWCIVDLRVLAREIAAATTGTRLQFWPATPLISDKGDEFMPITVTNLAPDLLLNTAWLVPQLVSRWERLGGTLTLHKGAPIVTPAHVLTPMDEEALYYHRRALVLYLDTQARRTDALARGRDQFGTPAQLRLF